MIVHIIGKRNKKEMWMGHNKLVDISEINVDKSLSKEKRIEKFISDVGDPYKFRVGDVEVSVSFDSGGEKLQDKMERYFENIVLREKAWNSG